jgi:hypothetical protein
MVSLFSSDRAGDACSMVKALAGISLSVLLPDSRTTDPVPKWHQLERGQITPHELDPRNGMSSPGALEPRPASGRRTLLTVPGSV